MWLSCIWNLVINMFINKKMNYDPHEWGCKPACPYVREPFVYHEGYFSNRHHHKNVASNNLFILQGSKVSYQLHQNTFSSRAGNIWGYLNLSSKFCFNIDCTGGETMVKSLTSRAINHTCFTCLYVFNKNKKAVLIYSFSSMLIQSFWQSATHTSSLHQLAKDHGQGWVWKLPFLRVQLLHKFLMSKE